MTKKVVQTNEDLLDELLSGAMAGFAMSGADGRLTTVLKQNRDLREEREEVLERMKAGAPPKTKVMKWEDLAPGDEFISVGGRWMKFVDDRGANGSIHLESTSFDPKGRIRYGHFFTTVEKIVE